LKKIILIALVLMLGGCAFSDLGKTSTGGAVYEYSKSIHPDGSQDCTARATSSREIVGATIRISQDCAFETVVEEAASPFEVMDRLIDLAQPK